MNNKPFANVALRRFDGCRMGEWFSGKSFAWLASVLTVGEANRVKALDVGQSIEFERAVSGHVGRTEPFSITRIE